MRPRTLKMQWFLMALISPLIGLSLVPQAKPPAGHPTDNHARAARFIDNHDGDTARFEITLCELPEITLTRKIRLAGVRCLEIPQTGPAEPDAIKERDALRSKLIAAKLITVVLHKRETNDRIEGEVFADGENICEFMKQFPQGGR